MPQALPDRRLRVNRLPGKRHCRLLQLAIELGSPDHRATPTPRRNIEKLEIAMRGAARRKPIGIRRGASAAGAEKKDRGTVLQGPDLGQGAHVRCRIACGVRDDTDQDLRIERAQSPPHLGSHGIEPGQKAQTKLPEPGDGQPVAGTPALLEGRLGEMGGTAVGGRPTILEDQLQGQMGVAAARLVIGEQDGDAGLLGAPADMRRQGTVAGFTSLLDHDGQQQKVGRTRGGGPRHSGCGTRRHPALGNGDPQHGRLRCLFDVTVISCGGHPGAKKPSHLGPTEYARASEALAITANRGHMSGMKVLVIEDDVAAASYMVRGLEESGHVASVAHDGRDGLMLAASQSFDVLVIDRMLPGLDGLGVIRTLRASGNRTPVLVLSALGNVDDRVEGLRVGGDDYLVKPYAFSELLARLEALTRRGQPNAERVPTTTLKYSDLSMDLLGRRVERRGKRIDLQPREFRLLEVLLRHPEQVLTRTMLLEKVWDYRFDPQTNIIDVHISRLRQKIDRDFEPPLIQTVRGSGYALRLPDPAA